jgi:D-alanyl-D-alanine carboxypeptidase
MYQPKGENPSVPLNRSGARIISMAISSLLAVSGLLGVATPAAAVDATPSPTPSATPSAMPISPLPTTSASPSPSVPPVYDIDAAGSIYVVVNKQRPLNPITYKPKLATVNGVSIAASIADQYKAMAAGMKTARAGILILNSGYRSFDSQTRIHANQVARLGLAAGEALAARPGYSEHQTGLAVDVSAKGQGCAIYTCFAKTSAGKWLAANAYKYGFILRYYNGQTAIHGYQFEPWHFRYVGVEVATLMKLKLIGVLERFWALPAAPTY